MATRYDSPALTARTPAAWFQQFLSTVTGLFGDLNPVKPLRHDPVAELLALAEAYESRQPGFAADLRCAALAYEGRQSTNAAMH